mgnify:FL=1|tara:strand:+ start:92061 stop:92645 length:585 start_codon:yes stop_codon:yes gene_type:complete
MVWLILGLVIFLGVHSVRISAPEFRQRMIAQRGENAWKGFYSLLALLGLGLIIWGFSIARYEGPIVYTPPTWMSHVALLLMLFSFVFLAASSLPVSRIKVAAKHPMLLAVKLWALAHLMANGDLASLLLFGSFLIWAIVDRISEKGRVVAGEGVPAVKPPVRNDIMVIVVGLLAYVLFVWKLHEWLIGVAPIAS